MYGRTISTVVVRNRWFDIPLTREESLQSDKKLIINFGPSQDPDGVTMVDSVKVINLNKNIYSSLFFLAQVVNYVIQNNF